MLLLLYDVCAVAAAAATACPSYGAVYVLPLVILFDHVSGWRYSGHLSRAVRSGLV